MASQSDESATLMRGEGQAERAAQCLNCGAPLTGPFCAECGQRDQPITEAERQAALKDIARAPKLMQPFLRRVVADPKGFEHGMMETMPKMLFALLPLFAAIVGVFYHGRKYPEHPGSTLIREVAIGALYAVVSVGALILTLYWVSVAT